MARNASDIREELNMLQLELIKALQEQYYCEDLTPPDGALGWSMEQLAAFFEAGGDVPPDATQPGGGLVHSRATAGMVPQLSSPGFSLKALSEDDRVGVESYQESAIRCGIPPRTNGLFLPSDPVMAKLIGDMPELRPFEPHQMHRTIDGGFGFQSLSTAGGFGLSLSTETPFDVRLFLPPGYDTDSRQVYGAVRFSEFASSARGLGDAYVHGGAIMTVLDEVTSQCVAIKCFTEGTTTVFESRILKKVEPHVTYRLEAEVTKQPTQFRYEVVGKLLDDASGTVYATAKSVMANVAALPGELERRYES